AEPVTPSGSPDAVTLFAAHDDRYYLLVDAPGTGSDASYTLDVDVDCPVGPAPAQCAGIDDWREDDSWWTGEPTVARRRFKGPFRRGPERAETGIGDAR